MAVAWSTTVREIHAEERGGAPVALRGGMSDPSASKWGKVESSVQAASGFRNDERHVEHMDATLAWLNVKLRGKGIQVVDLLEELKDGMILAALLEELTGTDARRWSALLERPPPSVARPPATEPRQPPPPPPPPPPPHHPSQRGRDAGMQARTWRSTVS